MGDFHGTRGGAGRGGAWHGMAGHGMAWRRGNMSNRVQSRLYERRKTQDARRKTEREPQGTYAKARDEGDRKNKGTRDKPEFQKKKKSKKINQLRTRTRDTRQETRGKRHERQETRDGGINGAAVATNAPSIGRSGEREGVEVGVGKRQNWQKNDRRLQGRRVVSLRKGEAGQRNEEREGEKERREERGKREVEQARVGSGLEDY